MQNEIARASRKPYIKQDFDATSCYDCIIPWMASLLSRSHGLHRNVCLVHARTLQEARYLLKKPLISDESYSHCRAFPIYGTGQGPGNSPMIWCFISSMLFDIYQEHALGASYASPDGSTTIRLFMLRRDNAIGTSPRSLTVLPVQKMPVRTPARRFGITRPSTVIQQVIGALKPSKVVTGKGTISWAEIVGR
jgi:hypothetical protein